MKPYEFNRINDYIDIYLDKLEDIDEWYYEFYLDDKISWCHHTNSILEFVGIVYFSTFRYTPEIMSLKILKGNKTLDIGNDNSYNTFIYWITGGNRVYMQTFVSFEKEVYPHFEKHKDEVFEILNKAEKVEDLILNLTDFIEESSMYASKLIQSIESQFMDEEDKNKEENKEK